MKATEATLPLPWLPFTRAEQGHVQSDEQLRSETGRPLEVHRQFVTYRVDELHPHPSYVRHHLTVPASQLSALAEPGNLVFLEPLVITQEGTILDGYARWNLARLQGRLTLQCIACDLTEEEALHFLLQMHRRSNGLNAFSRILLAQELEPWFREKARSNQRAGGQNKGSSNLTEAEKLVGPSPSDMSANSTTPVSLKAFSISNGMLSTSPVFQTDSNNLYSYPGANPSVSANGAMNGIVWTLDRKPASVPSLLHAYDATTLKELYNSNMKVADAIGAVTVFTLPTIANGKVYLTAHSSAPGTAPLGKLYIFGLRLVPRFQSRTQAQRE